MALFAITFRVGSDGNYNDRYNSIVDRIRHNFGTLTWESTTSFILGEAEFRADALASDIYVNSNMNNTSDQLLVINLTERDYAVRGKIESEPMLQYLMSLR